jgi:CheY-like chemotaxis protein
MDTIRLICWNPSDTAVGKTRLQRAGYSVDDSPFDGPPALRALREDPPAAVVIDLSRRPSQGRDVALVLRKTKATRRVPIVFVEGDPDKLKRLQTLLPDAVYTPWSRIRSALKRAIAHPVEDPVEPASVFEAYTGVPLAKKLGIKQDAVVLLVGAPAGFWQRLADLPAGARCHRRRQDAHDLAIWFVRSRSELERALETIVPKVGNDGLWIAWPKRSSGVPSDLSQVVVRKMGLATGLVDYKICSVDDTWSGLKFTRRARRGK